MAMTIALSLILINAIYMVYLAGAYQSEFGKDRLFWWIICCAAALGVSFVLGLVL